MTKGQKVALVAVGVAAALALLYFLFAPTIGRRAQLRPASQSTALVSSPPEPPANPRVIYQNTEQLDVIRGPDGGIQSIIRKITVTADE